MDLRFEDIDVAEILRETIDTYSVEADFHRVTIEIEAPPVLRGRYDRLAVEQVIANLVSNAIKYGDGKPVRVTLVAEPQGVRLQIEDRGIGISVENQARIFRPLRASRDRDHAYGIRSGPVACALAD